MPAVDQLTNILKSLSLGKDSVKNENELPSIVASNVQAEPKLLAKVVPEILDTVR